MAERHGGVSPSFLALNRNKRSITIDLATQAGRRAVLRMAKRLRRRRAQLPARGDGRSSDSRTRTCATCDPDVIFCEFYSYGPTGPLSHIGANDLALQAHSGMMSITGEPDRPPVRCGTSIVDLHASLALVTAILAALFHRERTGEGQAVETSLLRSSAHLMNYFYGEYWALGVIRGRMGTANHLSRAEPGVSRADGGVVIIAPSTRCGSGRRACARSFARPAGMAHDRGPAAHRAQIIEAISAVTRTMTERRADRAAGQGQGQRREGERHRRGSRPSAACRDRRRARAADERAARSRRPHRRSRCAARRRRRTASPPSSARTPDEILADLGFAAAEIDRARATKVRSARAPRANRVALRRVTLNRIDLEGRVAVITGGSGGIGIATAERMLLSGARVVLWDRDHGRWSGARAFPGARLSRC